MNAEDRMTHGTREERVAAAEKARRELNERRAAKGLPPIRYPGPATEPDA